MKWGENIGKGVLTLMTKFQRKQEEKRFQKVSLCAGHNFQSVQAVGSLLTGNDILLCFMRRGKVPALVRELIHDTRKMMLPFTAMKLREKKSNSLKDFVSIAGSLGVSHLMCFSTTETVKLQITVLFRFSIRSIIDAIQGTFLRLAKMPRGPTLYFKVNSK